MGARSERGTDRVRVVWDYEEEGALSATQRADLRDISTGLTVLRSWSGFRDELADIVEAREAGEIDSVTVWTFDDQPRLAELLYYSVDGIMTNEPQTLYKMWQATLE